MMRRVVSGSAIGVLIVGSLIISAISLPASEQVTPAARAASPAPAMPPRLESTPSVAEQMQALERHARMGVICYTGRFGSEMALRKDLAIALARQPVTK